MSSQNKTKQKEGKRGKVVGGEQRSSRLRSRSPAVGAGNGDASEPGSKRKIGPKSFRARAREVPEQNRDNVGDEETTNPMKEVAEFAEYLSEWDNATAEREERSRDPRDSSTSSVRSEISDCSVVLNDVNKLVHGPESKKKGKPVTTGQWEFKKIELAKKLLREEEQRIKNLTNPMIQAELSRKRRESENKMMEELRYQPTEDLARMIVDQVAVVDKVNTTSKTLKGGDQGSLNMAAATITAAAMHLVNRMQTGDETVVKDTEIEDLRKKTATLKKRVAVLQKRLEERQGVPWGEEEMEVDMVEVPNTPSQHKGRGKRRTSVMRDEASSDEERELPCRREEIREEIARNGMPAAMRPSLQGKAPKVIDPAIKPRGTGMEDTSLEGKIMSEVRRLETRFEEMFRGIIERISMPPPHPLTVSALSVSPAGLVTSTPRKNRKQGKGQDRKGKDGKSLDRQGGNARRVLAPPANKSSDRGAAAGGGGQEKRSPSQINAQATQPELGSWTEVVKKKKPQTQPGKSKSQSQ